jgi:hypothetical protein
MSNPLSDVYAQSGDRPSCMELESALLDGAAAIHCLTAERNQLRVRLESQELELVRLRAANEDLRRQIAVIGESYMQFASSCVTQLQRVGHAMQEVEQTQMESAELRA